jgi:hypothetical protein
VTREETLRAGVRILDPALRSAGFGFEPVYEGHYLCVRYLKKERVLELHFSDSLRLVSQRIDDLVVMHDDFMRALLGPNGGHYPPRSLDDPLEAFDCLRMDLEHHWRDFLRGRGREWREVAERALLDPRRFTVTHEFLQLEDARRDARSAFAARHFAKVVAFYAPIEDQLMPAERRRLEIARERVETGRLDGW